jgi:purine-binding chemotaxis protein CheW
MKRLNWIVVFTLDEQMFALHISAVERVIRVVEITPLPEAPEIVIGIINMQGNIIPVFDARKRFRLPDRKMRLADQFIIAHTSRYTVALLVDSVAGIFEQTPQETIDAVEVLPGMEYIEGVVKMEGGIVLIHNLDTFLSITEETALEDAIKEQQPDKYCKHRG